MKKLIVLLLLAGFFFTSYSQTGIKDKDVFIRHVFAAVQENDTAAFLRLFPDKDGFWRLYGQWVKKIADTADQKQSLQSLQTYFDTLSVRTYNAEFHKDFLERFLAVQQEAKHLKIDFSKAVMTEFKELQSGNTKNDLRPRFSGIIYFTSGDKEYSLVVFGVEWSEADQCFYDAFLSDLEIIDRQIDFSNDTVTEQVTLTSAEQEASEDPPPPPPPAKKKATTKKTPAPPAKKTTIKH